MSNLNLIPIGKCGKCGGVVSVPRAWWATTRPRETCESCGAIADPTRGLPVLEMRRMKSPAEVQREHLDTFGKP